MTDNAQTINEILGLTESYQHDIDEETRKCAKCNKPVEDLKKKVCPVVGSEEFHSYGQ